MHIRKYLSIFLIGLVFAIAGCNSSSDSGVDHETDTDGDGVTDNNDIDIDGDGITNNLDPDIDGDGKPNESDPDMDGDGVPDDQDNTPGGNDNPGEGPGGIEIDTSKVTLAAAMRNWENCLNASPSADCKSERTVLAVLTQSEVGSSTATINNSFDRFETYVDRDYAAKIKYVSTSRPVSQRTEPSREVYVAANGEHCVGMGDTTFAVGSAIFTVSGNSAPLLTFKKTRGYVSIYEDSLISKLCWGTSFLPRFVFDTQDNNQTYVMYLGSEIDNSVSATGVFTLSDGSRTTLTLRRGTVTESNE